MKDIFDAKISCKNCDREMTPIVVEKAGMNLRAVSCNSCGEKIFHPSDISKFNEFKDLKGKTFNVKLRMVGNSHAVSIPKEIVDFMVHEHREMKKDMDEFVNLCFEDFDRLSLRFGQWGERR